VLASRVAELLSTYLLYRRRCRVGTKLRLEGHVGGSLNIVVGLYQWLSGIVLINGTLYWMLLN